MATAVRNGPRQYLMACTYCGAWRDDEHPPTCRAFYGRAAWIAEGHSESCIEDRPADFWPYHGESLVCEREAPHG